MKVYTFFSESHRSLYERFLRSVARTNPGLEVVVDELEQECATGDFMSEGWGRTMRHKVNQIRRAIDTGEVFIHSDVDIVFARNIEKSVLAELGKADIAFQSDGPHNGGVMYCMGFFVCRPTPAVRRLFDFIHDNLDRFRGNDQLALNHAIGHHQSDGSAKDWQDVHFKVLSNAFFSYGHHRPPQPWTGESFVVPEHLAVFHANFTVGVDSKHRMIDYVASELGLDL